MKTEVKQKKQNSIKRWYELVKPKKSLMLIQFLTMGGASASHILAPIFAAKVITSIYKAYEGTGRWQMAWLWLLAGIANILARQVVNHINFIVYPSLQKYSYIKIQDRIFNKVMAAKELGFKKISKEKLINIVNVDINTVTDLSDKIATRSVNFLRMFVFLILTATVSWEGALIGLGIIIFNVIMFKFVNGKLAKLQDGGLAYKDRVVEHFSEVVRARNLAKDFGLTAELKKNYVAFNEDFFNNRKKYYFWQSMRDNWVYAMWNVFITLSSALFVFMVSKGSLTIENYLIITGYLLSCATLTPDALNFLADLGTANVAVMRINTLLALEERDLIDFGKTASADTYGEILLTNVSMSTGKVDGEQIGTLKEADMHFSKNTLTLIHGPQGQGKRAIFYLLRRKIKAESGVVTVNGIEVSEFSEQHYKKVFNFASYDPYFFKGSLLKNYLSINSDKKQIYKVCDMLKIREYIDSLPKGFDTDIDEQGENVSQYYRFMMGVAAALLSNSRFIVIYGTPLTMQSEEKEMLREVLQRFKKIRTIIMIMPDKTFAGIADNVYLVKGGKVEQVADEKMKEQD